MKVAHGLYRRLNPEERFRAAVEAFGRKDWTEIDRLNNACPSVTVQMQSPAYFGRLRGFHELAMIHGIGARDVMLGILACLFRLTRCARGVAEDAREDAPECTEVPDAVVPGTTAGVS